MSNETFVVIDTNLLLDDANIIYKLANEFDKIILPLTVLKELDNKKFDRDLSYSAREAIRHIQSFEADYPDKIEFTNNDSELSSNDLKIMEAAEEKKATLATKDISMSIMAKSKNLKTMLYDVVLNNIFDPYIHVGMTELNKYMFKNGVFDFARTYSGTQYDIIIEALEKIVDRIIIKDSWFFVIINARSVGEDKEYVYANHPIKNTLIRIDNTTEYLTMEVESSTLKSRDPYQNCAFFALKEAPHVLITGSWGTGKTLLGTGFTLSSSDRKAFITRPPTGISAKYSLGFLPGPQPLDAKILTPTGWTTMGELKVGDVIISYNGKPTVVEKVFDFDEKDVYEIETTNGGKTKACGDHLWATKNYNELKHHKDFGLRTTLEIKETLLNPNKGPKLNHTLPSNGIVEFENTELPIPPYTLGALLGDGSFSDNISIINEDYELLDRVSNELKPYGMELNNKTGIQYHIKGDYRNNKPAKKVKLTNTTNGEEIIYETIGYALDEITIDRGTLNSRCKSELIIEDIKYEFLPNKNRWQNYVKNAIYELNLEGTKANTKFIPDIYKYTSIENRIALLQGLMDTDGTIKESTGEQSFTTVSKKLCNDIIELCRSLGINATYYTRNRVGKTTNRPSGGTITTKHISYEVSIPKTDEFDIFYISRKRNKIKKVKGNKHNKIKNITLLGKEKVRCIKISDPSSLYITDDYIVTHNTKEEKMIDWCSGFLSSLYYLYANTRGQKKSKGVDTNYDYVKDELFSKKFEILPINMIQGLSLLNDDILIVDEVQLLDINYMSMILSRPSETGKLILLGDLKQTYNVVKPSESGLLKLLRTLPHPSLAYVELKNSYRSDLLEIADKLQDKALA